MMQKWYVGALHHVNKEESVSEWLFQFTGLLSNLACVMAVYVNNVYGVLEVPFHTKSSILK